MKAEQAADNVVGRAAYLSGSGDVYQEASDFDFIAEDIPESLLVKPLSRFYIGQLNIMHNIFGGDNGAVETTNTA